MTSIAVMRRLGRQIAKFARDPDATSAVEFALLLPVMLTLYIGSTEISQAVSANRKVTLVARTVADLVARTQSVDNPAITDILTASTAVMAPFGPSNLVVKVSSIQIDAQGKATIAWSRSSPAGYGYAVNSPVTTVPAEFLKNTSTYLIWGEVAYTYSPFLAGPNSPFSSFTGSLNLHDQIYMSPRLGNSVTCNPPPNGC